MPFGIATSRIVKTHPLPLWNESARSIEVGLHVVDHGADPEVVRDELFWLAARVAWQTPCNKADVDLQMLIDRGEVWAEIGTYLRAVVEPFMGSSALTIGDVFMEDVIPIARERPENALEEPIGSADEESAVISADETVTTRASDAPADLPAVIAAKTVRHRNDAR